MRKFGSLSFESPLLLQRKSILAQSCMEIRVTLHMMPDEGCAHLTVPVPIDTFWHHCLDFVGTLFPCLSELERSSLFTLKCLSLIQWDLLRAPNSFSFGILYCREQLGVVIYVVVRISTDDHCEPGIMLKQKKIKLHLYMQEPASIPQAKNKPPFLAYPSQKPNRMFKMHILIL